MKVQFNPEILNAYLRPEEERVVEDYAILDVRSDTDHIQLTTGLPYSVPDTNPCHYDDNEQMFSEMWDMYAAIGQGEYVSPNVGAQFSAFKPCGVVQSKAAPLKTVTGSLNRLLLDSRVQNVVAIDPGKGVVSALMEEGKSAATFVYTSKEYPKKEIEDILTYAHRDGFHVNFMEGGKELGVFEVDGHERRVPYHTKILKELDTWIGEIPTIYLGSNGHLVRKYENSRGYEVNPYHHGAHRFIDSPVEDEPGCVHYSLRSGGMVKTFDMLPYSYRYLPQQLFRFHRLAKAKVRELASFVLDFSDALKSACRLPPPAMKVYTSDVRFMVVRGEFNELTSGYGQERETATHILDVPGFDLFYSRFWRIKELALKYNKLYPKLIRSYAEALKEQVDIGGDIWIVSTQHVDPIRVKSGTGTHFMYWLSAPLRGAFSRRCGMWWSVLSADCSVSTPQGSVAGIQCVSLVPGNQYVLHRVKYPVWSHVPGQFPSNAHVDPMRYLTCHAPYIPGSIQPITFYYEKSEFCTDQCLRYHLNPSGDILEYCADVHSVSPVYIFDSIYVPVGFSQFSAVPWEDEFVSDYYECERPMVPLAFEEGYEGD